jgi:hypothetical protein
MSQPNPNRFKSYPMTPETNYTGWMVGGLLALIFGLGVIAVISRSNPTADSANSSSLKSVGSATNAKRQPAQ